MQERDGQRLLPELYFVLAESVAAEREQPHSQPREPNANVPLVWAQSLYLVGVLLQEGLVEPGDIDPLGRRYSRAAASLPCVQVCLLAEDELVRSRLAAHGIAAQTVAALLPVQVRDAAQLAAVYAELGRDATLGLTGRPPQPLGGLATSLVFERGRELSLCLPAFGRQRGFYLALDNRLLAEEIGNEIVYLRRHWRRDGQPLLCLLLTAPMLDAPGADALQASLAALAAGDAAAVCVGPLEALLPQATRRRLDGLADWPAAVAEVPAGAAGPAVLRWEEAATRPLTAERAAALVATPDAAGLLQQLERSRNPYEQIELLSILWRRAGPMCDAGFGGSVLQLTEAVYARACRERRWGVLRRAAGLLDIHDDGLEEAVAEIVARGMRVTLGRSYDAGAVVARPLAQAELQVLLHTHGGDDGRGRVLIEEIVLLLGMLVRADGGLFAGLLTLRPWQAVLLVTGWLAREHGVAQAEAYDHLLDLSPHAILGRLREVIANAQDMAANLVWVQTLHAVGGGGTLARVEFPAANDPVLTPEHGGWPGWREMTGVIAGLPPDFHERVWKLLQHCAGLVIGDQLDSGNALVSAVAGGDSTPGERGFALQVEELLNRIQAPEYRQLTIEALLALSEVARANPVQKIGELLVLDVLIGTAVKLGWAEAGGAEAGYDEQVPQAWQALYASPPHRVANLVAAALAFLLVAPAEPAAPAAPAEVAEVVEVVEVAEVAEVAPAPAVAAASEPVA
jgi:phosphorylase kinase alpha/beta subunit